MFVSVIVIHIVFVLFCDHVLVCLHLSLSLSVFVCLCLSCKIDKHAPPQDENKEEEEGAKATSEGEIEAQVADEDEEGRNVDRCIQEISHFCSPLPPLPSPYHSNPLCLPVYIFCVYFVHLFVVWHSKQ